jgi:hypothetical protein
MGATGTAELDFGAFPGAYDASIPVTGQGSIVAGSLVEAWVLPKATADHTHDEHLVDPPKVIAGSIVAGTGFTIYSYPEQDAAIPDRLPLGTTGSKNAAPRHWGKWTVAWTWN